MLISIVIPIYNEEESLPELHRQICRVARDADYQIEMILVSDGSTDGSWSAIEQLACLDHRVLGIRLRRNFGKAAALAAGFDAAQGEVVITMDADLQDDPAELPAMLGRLEEGLDVVSGWKQVRHDPWHKRWPSKLFNWLVGVLTGVRLHDHNCGFKCYRRDVILEVRLYGELHRFVPVLAAARGFRVGEVIVNHRPRQHGRSKYGISRIIKGFLDLLTVKFLTGYGHRPQHVLGTIGLVSLLLGGAVLVYLAGDWALSRLNADIADDVHLHERPALYYGLGLLILGGQFFSMGLLAEMITAFLARDADTYSVAELTSREPMPTAADHERGSPSPAGPRATTQPPETPHAR